MAPYIELYDREGRIARYDIPSRIKGENGTEYTVGSARQRGGNGVVFEATRESVRFNPPCAVKVLRRQDPVRVDRFHNEVRIQAALEHPRIAKLYDHGLFDSSDRRIPWAAMELGGGNLRQHVESEGPLPARNLLATAIDMCSALEHVHGKQIIHRDVKPENFVWSKADGRAMMIDFGIAKYIGEDVAERPLDQFTMHMEFVGPVFFSSPELIEYSRDKSHPVDQRSDIFQAAKVIWFLATNRVSAGIPSKKLCPFGGRLHQIVCECLNEDPADRPDSAAGLAALLKGIA